MGAVTVTVTGLDKLRIIDPKRARRAMVTGMRKGMNYLHGRVPPYPEAPAGSTYRRTGTLGRRTTSGVREEAGAVIGVIGNNTEYAPYVIGRETQAWMHEGRWWTLDAVVEDNVEEIGGIITGELNRAFGV